MADFKKFAVTVAGLTCMLGVTGAANAQNFVGFSCNATATPFDMRAEGITEQGGDLVLTCTGGTVTPLGLQIPAVNVTVSLNTNLTSRLLGGSTNLTDALLLINEPPPNTQSFCPASGSTLANQCIEYGFGTGGGQNTQTYNPQAGPQAGVPNTPRFNGVQGTLVGPSQVTFFGVPIDPPGPAQNLASTVAGPTPTLTLRIANIRANASALGAPTGFSTSAVFETVSTSAGFPINQSVQTIGFVRRGLTSSIAGVGSFQQCISRTVGSSSSQTITFTEGFATATKLRTPIFFPGGATLSTPGALLNSESQFVPNGVQGGFLGGGTLIGTADYATRVRLTFNNLQTGVTIYVPTTIQSNQTVAGIGTGPTEIMTLTTTEAGAFSAVAASSATGLPANYAALSGNIAVYEVTTQSISSPFTIESFSVPVITVYTANPGVNSPSLGASSVSVDFAPLSTVITAAASPIPRFVPSSTPLTGFSINACQTVLLFPFLSNLAGFDTGIAISNTSRDPFGTIPQPGTCTLNFYGTAEPAAFITPVVSPTVNMPPYATLVSNVAPGFQGYMIAQCRFQFAHGFAFITDGFTGPGRGLSQGYLALIIPDPTANAGSRSPSNANFPPINSGEGLTN